MSTNNIQGNQVDSETQDMLRSFVSEAFDSLDTNEPTVEHLRNDDNSEYVNSIFRVFHTLKGLSGFFEMYVINKVTHEAETLLDIIRKQNRRQSEETITVVYQTFDFLRDLLQRVSADFTDQSGFNEAEDMIIILRDCIEKVKSDSSGASAEPPTQVSMPAPAPAPQPVAPVPELNLDDVIDFSDNTSPAAAPVEEPQVEAAAADMNAGEFDNLISDEMLDQYLVNASELIDTSEKNLLILEKETDNYALVQETFGAIHSLKGNSGFMGFGEIEEISMDMEMILDSIRSKSLEIEQNVITILLSNIETVRARLSKIQESASKRHNADNAPHEQPAPKPSAPAPKPAAPAPTATPNPTPSQQSAPAPAVSAAPAAPAPAPAPAPAHVTQPPAKKMDDSEPREPKAPMQNMQRKDIRVETTKIDKLFDLVGELITIETMVTKNPDIVGLNIPNFHKSANMLNKIARELQEISMSIRMMPLEGQFNKMKRLVRDVSLKMNKKVNLEISGAETEMDKNVIDEIADPLVHILRNSLDHGIESPEDRVAKGKDEIGNVSLSARYEGNEILIVVEDDGAGINRDVILRKAEEKGLLKVPPDQMKDKDVFGLIFEPGFSTAAKVTDISGRGVGMDVVKKNIEKLRGSVDVASTYGKGSRITLRIPLTLAIMEAMLIRIGDAIFAMPILAIRESFRPNPSMISKTMDGLEVVKVREEIHPVVRIHEVFDIEPENRDLVDGILIITETRDRKICLFADEIVGQQQAVIKGLSDYIGKVPGITGCMIMGDGGIGLIIDIESLIEISQKSDNKQY